MRQVASHSVEALPFSVYDTRGHLWVRVRWATVFCEVAVEGYVFHDFRRTATRHMIDRYNITVERDTQNTLAQTQAYLIQQQHRRLGRQSDTPPPEEPWPRFMITVSV
jgi:hypothetical protein